MRRIHIAIAVTNFDAALIDYTARLGAQPVLCAVGRYALWRTELLNFTISCKPGQPAGVRHLGFEDDHEAEMREEVDTVGIVWEYFSAEAQAAESEKKFPNATRPEL